MWRVGVIGRKSVKFGRTGRSVCVAAWAVCSFGPGMIDTTHGQVPLAREVVVRFASGDGFEALDLYAASLPYIAPTRSPWDFQAKNDLYLPRVLEIGDGETCAVDVGGRGGPDFVYWASTCYGVQAGAMRPLFESLAEGVSTLEGVGGEALENFEGSDLYYRISLPSYVDVESAVGNIRKWASVEAVAVAYPGIQVPDVRPRRTATGSVGWLVEVLRLGYLLNDAAVIESVVQQDGVVELGNGESQAIGVYYSDFFSEYAVVAADVNELNYMGADITVRVQMLGDGEGSAQSQIVRVRCPAEGGCAKLASIVISHGLRD